MKDKEWLKDKIKDEEYNLKYVYNNFVPYEKVLIADDVYDLIKQLDEPEVLSQEWIDKHAASADTISYYSKDNNVPVITALNLKGLLVPKQEEVDRAYKDGYEKGKESEKPVEAVKEYFKSVEKSKEVLEDLGYVFSEKSKKPVIPKFVADWIEEHDLHGNNPLREYRDLENDFNEGWTNEEDAAVYHWVNKNPYAFIDALRYGCEVEKEKRYHVVNKENYFMLRKYDGLVDILRVSSSMGRDEYGKDTSFMLTEKEIKDYDARYWAFAEEVTE